MRTYQVLALIPYARNNSVVTRKAIFGKLQQQILKSTAQVRVSLFGLGGTGYVVRDRVYDRR